MPLVLGAGSDIRRSPGGSDPYAAYLLFDSMTDADGVALHDHVPEKGGPWVEQSGTWFIDTNQLKETTGNLKTCAVDVGQANVVFSAVLDAQGGSDPGMVFRVTDDANYYLVAANSLGVLNLFKVVAGGYTLLATFPYAHVAGDVLKVSAVGSALIVYVNDVEKINVTDSTHLTQTKFGFFSHAGNFISSRWDDVRIVAS